MVKRHKSLEGLSHREVYITSTYGSRYMTEPIPKYRIPEESMSSRVAYQLIHDEVSLDGRPAQNLASFCTTWMEPEADKLIAEGSHYNLADEDEYPHVVEIQERCVNMIADLFNAPERGEGGAVGTSTIGSSEAIMLAGLAMKFNWRARRQSAGLPRDKPNLVMGENVQVVWEKFVRYFDVEPNLIPIERDRYVITPEAVANAVDERTIGVCAILGTTFTGEFEPIKDIHDTLVEVNGKNGWDIPLHVDAASGGFVAPFLYPDLEWDFRLPLVRSINVSGHKYGLVYPGVGWVIWREESALPEELIFHVNYLGGDMPTFNLNFSRPASHVIAQYYNFLRLGRRGYTRILETLKINSDYIRDELIASGKFILLSDDHSLPGVVWMLNPGTNYTVFELSDKLRERGWIIPAYTMPKNAEDIAVLRAVVREGISRDMADNLVKDILYAAQALEQIGPRVAPVQVVPGKKSVKAC